MLTNNIFNRLKLNKLKRDLKTIFLVRNRRLFVILSVLNSFSSNSFTFSSNVSLDTYTIPDCYDYYIYNVQNQTNQIKKQ